MHAPLSGTGDQCASSSLPPTVCQTHACAARQGGVGGGTAPGRPREMQLRNEEGNAAHGITGASDAAGAAGTGTADTADTSRSELMTVEVGVRRVSFDGGHLKFICNEIWTRLRLENQAVETLRRKDVVVTEVHIIGKLMRAYSGRGRCIKIVW